MINIKRTIVFLLLTLGLSGCNAFNITPVPPPAIQPYAQEITRAQSLTLQKVGTVSAQGQCQRGTLLLDCDDIRQCLPRYLVCQCSAVSLMFCYNANVLL
ncbi:putative biofilm stress and motility protein A [Yersinia pseudotuberculosis]|nr:putative biofilm stress and motility protein A [Yersinia pseudotuberculosis]